MKILRISLCNLASLAGEHTVDFTQAPLVNTGLFSISGPTGSGKSTLLDALCLALYAETPRLAVVQGDASVDDRGKDIKQSDVRNVLRRGCGDGYAEAAFVGVDGEVYTARWIARRARNNPKGALQKTDHVLLKGNTVPGAAGEMANAGTSTEVKSTISAKVGLTFDQFRRAVLLAQGDFATFLKAKDAERAEILQALTGTERFAKISMAVFQRNKKEEGLVAELKQKIGANLPMSEEERAVADEELRGAVALRDALLLQLAERKKQEFWFLEEANRRKDLEEALSQVRECLDRVEADKPRAREMQWIMSASIDGRPRRSSELEAQKAHQAAVFRVGKLREREGILVEEYERTHGQMEDSRRKLDEVSVRQRELGGDLAKARLLDGELVPLEAAAVLSDKEYEGALSTFSQAERELQTLKAELRELAEQKEALEQRLRKFAPFETFAREVDVWLERFKAEAKSRVKLTELHKRKEGASKAADSTQAQLQQISEALPELRKKAELSGTLLTAAAEKAGAFNVEEILSQRRTVLSLQAVLQEVKANLDAQKNLRGQQASTEESLKALAVQIAGGRNQLADLRDVAVPGARHALKCAWDSLRVAEAAVSEHAVVLREALVKGQACPVCGSTEHPNEAGGAAVEQPVLAALKRDVRSKEALLEKLQGELSGAEVLAAERERQEREMRLELEDLASRMSALAAYEPADAVVLEVWTKPEGERELDLVRMQLESTEKLKYLDGRDLDRMAADKKLSSARSDAEKSQTLLLKAEAEEAQARILKGNADQDLSRILQDLAILEAEHRVAFAAIDPVLKGLESGEYDYERNSEAYLKWYEKGAREWNTSKDLLDEKGRQDTAMRQRLEPLKNALEAARQALEVRKKKREEARGNFISKKNERALLLGGRAVPEAETAMVSELEAASKAADLAGRRHSDAEKALSTQRGVLEEQQRQVTSLEAALNAATAAVDEWLQIFSAREARETNREDLDGWLGRESQWIEREKQGLEDSVKRLAAARGRELEVCRQMEEHLKTRPTGDDLGTVKAEALRLAEDVKAAGAVADSKRARVLGDDERGRRAGEFRKSLEAQERQCAPWQKLNALIGSENGSRFRNIAQQWTLEILLKHANAQLKMLSGRYRLERLRESLNILVEDLAMDGQQRSVHSLSGGESFLVSLGLALGLASLTSSRLLIESLFIDEGFGSLDSETLRVALNALSHLESQGRKVGVISHVSDMVDAIPVQVRVVRVSGGSSKIVV